MLVGQPEFEADRIGVVLATRAGYDAYGARRAAADRSFCQGRGRVALLFKTHPLPDDRFDRIKGATLGSRFYRRRN